MAGETIFACRHVKVNSVAVTDATHARVVPSSVARKDQGPAGSVGQRDAMVTYRRVMVEVYGTDPIALLALIAAVKASVEVGTFGVAGALEKLTVKNVYFFEPIGQVEVPANDAGGSLAVFGIRGVGLWATTDTFALMIVAAAGA
jgi:hypothetical protein